MRRFIVEEVESRTTAPQLSWQVRDSARPDYVVTFNTEKAALAYAKQRNGEGNE